MSKKKKKVRKLTDEQYNAYISTLKSEASLYCADGSIYVPPQLKPEEEKKKNYKD